MKLSVVIIAKNAQAQIKDAIASVYFAEEVIVIDNNSTDQTEKVAESSGAKVFKHATKNFSELRNLGLEKTRGEWVLYIDTDERIDPELAKEIKQKISDKKHQKTVAYKIKRKNFYLGNHQWPYIEKLERLFKKKTLKGWQGKLHESPIIDGNVGELNGFLLHYTHRDLTSMLNKTIEWSEIEADLRKQANHPEITWWRLPRVMLSSFWEFYIKQGGWRVGTAGLIESIYQSFSIFITYAKLWELQQKIKDENR